MRSRLTYANVAASVALLVALGGTSYAAIKLPPGSVTSREVKDRSLRAVDLAKGVVPAGSRGPRGTAGPIGPVGPAGPTGPPGPAQAEDWKALEFTNGWSNYGGMWESAGYSKDQLGIVHLRGWSRKATGRPAG